MSKGLQKQQLQEGNDTHTHLYCHYLTSQGHIIQFHPTNQFLQTLDNSINKDVTTIPTIDMYNQISKNIRISPLVKD
jgi:hypothetical protein